MRPRRLPDARVAPRSSAPGSFNGAAAMRPRRCD